MTAQLSTTYNKEFNNQAEIRKIKKIEKKPVISTVNDLESDTINTNISVKSIITITGKNLKIDIEKGESVRYINCENLNQYIPIVKFQRNKDKQLVFLSPLIIFKKGIF